MTSLQLQEKSELWAKKKITIIFSIFYFVMEAKNIITNSEFKERKSELCLLNSTKMSFFRDLIHTFLI